MACNSEDSKNSELCTTLLDEQAPVATYVLYPADATDKELETTWIRFEECDSITLEKIR